MLADELFLKGRTFSCGHLLTCHLLKFRFVECPSYSRIFGPSRRPQTAPARPRALAPEYASRAQTLTARVSLEDIRTI